MFSYISETFKSGPDTTIKMKRKVPVLIAGLENAGKTKLLKRMSDKLKHEQLCSTSKVKVRGNKYDITFVVRELDRSNDKLNLWLSNLQNCEALIYVIDLCATTKVIQSSLRILEDLLKAEKFYLKPRPLLIWLSKKNHNGDISEEAYKENVSQSLLAELKKRKYKEQRVSVYERESISDSFHWLAEECLEADKEKKKEKEKRDKDKKKTDKVLNWIKNKKDEVHVFMAGMENVGKSTILEKMTKETTSFWKNNKLARLKLDKFDELDKKIYVVWKVRGDERKLWKHQLKGSKILIFVVDATVKPDSALTELRKLLNTEELATRPLLIFYNKKMKWDNVKEEYDEKEEIPCFSSLESFKKLLKRQLKTELKNRAYHVQPCTAVHGEGLCDGFLKLKQLRKEQKKLGKPAVSA